MKFTIHNAAQGTPEWLEARAGRVTGSRASDVLAKGKTGESDTRKSYKNQIVSERLTGKPKTGGFINSAMQWGTEQEPFARAAYEAKTGLFVRQTGFLACDENLIGCSLDGDVNEFDGIQEFKCPETTTHLCWIEDDKIPSKHMPQLIHNLWITGAKWCDFISYDPRLPEHLQLFIVRLTRESIDFDAYSKEVFQFLREVEIRVNYFLKMGK